MTQSCQSVSSKEQSFKGLISSSSLKNNWNVAQSSNLDIQHGATSKILQNHLCVNHQSVRFRKYKGGETYRPSAWRRAHKHGFERVVSTPGLKEALWRKILKGRRELFIVPRFMNYPLKSKKAQKELPILKKGLPKFYPYQRQVKVWKKV